MDQSSHPCQKGQLTGLVGPQALYCQSLINKLNEGTTGGASTEHAHLVATSKMCYYKVSFDILIPLR